jgi:bifunctional DNA-binding transcriptional regulator/antitoxin component of YhaV-PrlF toxin-antitoxin module
MSKQKIEELLKQDIDTTIVKEVSVLGKDQLSIKLPKEIVEELNIKKGDKIKFIIEEKEEGIKNLKFEVINKNE